VGSAEPMLQSKITYFFAGSAVMKAKSVQIRIGKEEIDALVKEAIIRQINVILKKLKVDEEIKMAVNEAVIDVELPAIDEKILELEARLKVLEGKNGNGR
jgi:hypothetical protein